MIGVKKFGEEIIQESHRQRELRNSPCGKLSAINDKFEASAVEWVSDPTKHPQERSPENTQIRDIASKEASYHFSDDLERYARESSKYPDYFNAAWGNVDHYRATAEYFHKKSVPDSPPPHVIGNFSFLANFASPKAKIEKEDIPKLIEPYDDFIKHVGRFSGALHYQAKVAGAVADYIKSVIDRGGGSIKKAKVLFKEDQVILGQDPHEALAEKILNHLAEKNLPDPTIFHHIQSAFQAREINGDLLYVRGEAVKYFRAMQKNLETNERACKKMIARAEKTKDKLLNKCEELQSPGRG